MCVSITAPCFVTSTLLPLILSTIVSTKFHVCYLYNHATTSDLYMYNYLKTHKFKYDWKFVDKSSMCLICLFAQMLNCLHFFFVRYSWNNLEMIYVVVLTKGKLQWLLEPLNRSRLPFWACSNRGGNRPKQLDHLVQGPRKISCGCWNVDFVQTRRDELKNDFCKDGLLAEGPVDFEVKAHACR